MFPPSVVKRFKERLKPDGDCLRYTAGHTTHGYGSVYVGNKKVIHAHTFAYILKHGPLPKDKPHVLHSTICKFRDCCKLEHLRAGNPKENASDRETLGRNGAKLYPERMYYCGGENSGRTTLTAYKVKSIRRLYAFGNRSYSNIASIYGISSSSVYKICAGQRWK